MPADTPTQHTLPRLADLLHAAACLTVLPLTATDPRRRDFAAATVFLPVVGLGLGLFNLGVDRLASVMLAAAAVPAVLVVVWVAASGSWRGVPSWWLVLQAALKVLALSTTTTRGAALLFAPLLGAWAIVVTATGTRDAAAPERKFNPAVNFQEFAVASVITAAVVFTIAEAFGILLFAVAGAVVLLVRLWAYRSGRGVSWTTLRLTADGIEVVVCGLVAVLT